MISLPQHQRLLHLRPAQVEIAILQPQVFARQFLAAGLKRRRRLLLSSSSFVGADLDLAGRQLGIDRPFGPAGDLAGHANHVLGAQRAGRAPEFPAPLSGPKTTCVLP